MALKVGGVKRREVESDSLHSFTQLIHSDGHDEHGVDEMGTGGTVRLSYSEMLPSTNRHR